MFVDQDLSTLPKEQLEQELAAQAAHVDAGLCRLVELAAECERRLNVGSDGVTFAVYVKSASKASEGVLELNGAPLVLDYQFRTFEQLAKLESPYAEGTGLYSRSMINAQVRKRAASRVTNVQPATAACAPTSRASCATGPAS